MIILSVIMVINYSSHFFPVTIVKLYHYLTTYYLLPLTILTFLPILHSRFYLLFYLYFTLCIKLLHIILHYIQLFYYFYNPCNHCNFNVCKHSGGYFTLLTSFLSLLLYLALPLSNLNQKSPFSSSFPF